MKKQAWLISYSHPGGFGRFVNYRTDDNPPSFANIESMEHKIAEQQALRPGVVCVIAVSKLQDEEY